MRDDDASARTMRALRRTFDALALTQLHLRHSRAAIAQTEQLLTTPVHQPGTAAALLPAVPPAPGESSVPEGPQGL